MTAPARAALLDLARELGQLQAAARVQRRQLAALPLGKPARRVLDEWAKVRADALADALAALCGPDGDTVADWLDLADQLADRLPAAAAAAAGVEAAGRSARELADDQGDAAAAVLEVEE
jgi:hypothetical protein